MSKRVAPVGKAISHPLTLLLVGAFVTSLVVPSITRSWQDHEKALAVKSELVEDLTFKTSRFLAAIQFAREGGDDDARAVNDAYKQFLVDGAVLAARLSARIPEEPIAARWRAYVRLVEKLYALGGRAIRGGGDARTILAQYQRTAKPLPKEAQLERRRAIQGTVTAADRDWVALFFEAVGQRDAIAQQVLHAEEVAV